MLEKDSPIFLQNINMIGRQLFLLFKKSTTFWDNPRICLQSSVLNADSTQHLGMVSKVEFCVTPIARASAKII